MVSRLSPVAGSPSYGEAAPVPFSAFTGGCEIPPLPCCSWNSTAETEGKGGTGGWQHKSRPALCGSRATPRGATGALALWLWNGPWEERSWAEELPGTQCPVAQKSHSCLL